MKEVVVCIGSNIANKECEMELAFQWLNGILDGFRYSGAYATDATSKSLSPMPYLNGVGIGMTSLGYDDLKKIIRDYETTRGRKKAEDAQGIIIDIDIVFFGGENKRQAESQSSYFRKGFHMLNQSNA